MAKARPAILSLNGGEVDQETIARSDIESYSNKNEVFENVLPAVKGGAKRAPGTRYIANTLGDAFAVLRPWRYSRDQAFVMEMTEEKIRFLQDTEDAPGFVQAGVVNASIGSWVDASTGAASTTAAAPTWGVQPWDFVTAANKPLQLQAPAAGGARAVVTCTTGSPSARHTLVIAIRRGPVEIRIGTSSGGSQIIESAFDADVLKLTPGVHALTFTPGAGTFYVDARIEYEGRAAIYSMTFNTAAALALSSPYQEEELRALRFDQTGDQRWACVRSQPPLIIERRANDSWALKAFLPDNGPWMPDNDDADVTLAVNGATGPVTLTASKSLFKAGHAGALFRLRHTGQYVEESLDGADQWSTPIRVSSAGVFRGFAYQVTGTFTATWTLQRSVGSEFDWQDVLTGTGTTAYVPYNDGYDNEIIYYRIGVAGGNYTSGTLDVLLVYGLGETEGVVRIVAVLSATSATADVIKTVGKTVATTDWAEGAWSDVRGWPSSCAFHQGRLYFARDTSRWASAPDDFYDFSVGAEDDDAIARNVATGDTSPNVWLASVARLLDGAEASEYEIRSTSFDEPITPLNMTLREVASRGSADVGAIKHDSRVMHVSASAQRLLRLSYDVDAQAYAPSDLTRLHEYVAGADGFVDLWLQKEPEPRAYAVRGDGQLAVLTFSEAEAVVGWARLLTGAQGAGEEWDSWEAYESGCAIPSGSEDRVYVTTRRTVNAATVRFIERFEKERWTVRRRPTTAEIAAAWRVHAGLKYSGAPTSTLSGLGHLEGRTVAVWGDGSDLGSFVVTDGAIDLDAVEVSTAIVGLPYLGRIMSGKLPYGGEAGPAVGVMKKITRLMLLLHQTALGSIRVGGAFMRLHALEDRDGGFTMDAGVSLFSGEVVDDDYGKDESKSRDPRVCIEMRGAGPAAVLGYLPTIAAYEKL